jgi:peptidoglycan/LPS O-acetylase OafA/YrhL
MNEFNWIPVLVVSSLLVQGLIAAIWKVKRPSSIRQAAPYITMSVAALLICSSLWPRDYKSLADSVIGGLLSTLVFVCAFYAALKNRRLES